MKKLSTKQKDYIRSLFQLFHFVTRSFLIGILVIMVAFCALFTLYIGDSLLNVSKNKSPLFGAYVIASPSMTPTIQTKDAIVIKRVDHDDYQVGDIITFASSDINYNGLKVTHRIVEKETVGLDQSIYTTKGDNNPIIDPTTVRTDSIYGKVLFKIPKIGYAQDFLSKPTNYFLILLVTAIIFICYDVVRIMIAINKKKVA